MSAHTDGERSGGPDGGGGVAGAVAAWAAWAAASFALWLALVDNTHAPELIVGAGVALVAASAALVVRQQRRVVLRPDARWLLRAWRPLVQYLLDVGRLARALPTRGGGGFLAIPIDVVEDDPRAAARRVAMQTSGSFAPNTYVLGTDHEHGVLLIHQLVRGTDPRADVDPLRLR
jgi:multisubunit Na+/H+ antiporter MnhE subunit